AGLGPITVIEPRPSAELRMMARTKAVTLVGAPSQVSAKNIAACVVAMKPQILKTEAGSLALIAQSGALMISIAAGTTIAAMTKAWGRKARIVRAMPNTPGAIGAGITGLYAPGAVMASARKLATQLLSALGQTVWVQKEGLIDTVT